MKHTRRSIFSMIGGLFAGGIAAAVTPKAAALGRFANIKHYRWHDKGLDPILSTEPMPMPTFWVSDDPWANNQPSRFRHYSFTLYSGIRAHPGLPLYSICNRDADGRAAKEFDVAGHAQWPFSQARYGWLHTLAEGEDPAQATRNCMAKCEAEAQVWFRYVTGNLNPTDIALRDAIRLEIKEAQEKHLEFLLKNAREKSLSYVYDSSHMMIVEGGLSV